MVTLSFRQIARRLRETELPAADLVIGIGSGGIVPAAMIAFHLDAELFIISLNYRDEQNNPRYEPPVICNFTPRPGLEDKRILLVDDVSVSGKTLKTALALLEGYNVKTLTMKGKADYVLFPEIPECVRWPWKY